MNPFKVPLTEEELAKIPGVMPKNSERIMKKVHIKIFDLEDEVEAEELAELMSKGCMPVPEIIIIHQEHKFFENGMCKSFTIWAELENAK